MIICFKALLYNLQLGKNICIAPNKMLSIRKFHIVCYVTLMLNFIFYWQIKKHNFSMLFSNYCVRGEKRETLSKLSFIQQLGLVVRRGLF